MKHKKSGKKKLGFHSKKEPDELTTKKLSIDFENLKILGGDTEQEIYVQGICDGEICTVNMDFDLLTEMLKHYIEFKINHYERVGINNKLAGVMIEAKGYYNNDWEIPFYCLINFSKEIKKIFYWVEVKNN